MWTLTRCAQPGLKPADFRLTTLPGNMLFLKASAATKNTCFAPFGGNGPYL